MSSELIINASVHETRLAILENDRLVALYIEQASQHALAGGIFKGRVTRVLPGMQSAFVHIVLVTGIPTLVNNGRLFFRSEKAAACKGRKKKAKKTNKENSPK